MGTEAKGCALPQDAESKEFLMPRARLTPTGLTEGEGKREPHSFMGSFALLFPSFYMGQLCLPSSGPGLGRFG